MWPLLLSQDRTHSPFSVDSNLLTSKCAWQIGSLHADGVLPPNHGKIDSASEKSSTIGGASHEQSTDTSATLVVFDGRDVEDNGSVLVQQQQQGSVEAGQEAAIVGKSDNNDEIVDNKKQRVLRRNNYDDQTERQVFGTKIPISKLKYEALRVWMNIFLVGDAEYKSSVRFN